MPHRWRGNFFGGRFHLPGPGGTRLVSDDPADLAHPVGTIREVSSAVDAAVDAAARAFPAWSETPLARRRAALTRFQGAVRRRRRLLTEMIVHEIGKPLWEAEREVDRLIARVDETLTHGWARVQPFEVSLARDVRGVCQYRPHGVLAILGPFNFPAHLAAGQFLPGLLAGNTIVFKPSEYTPFVGQLLAECAAEARMPAGVFNVVVGTGAVGARLVEHPAVRAVLFTGSSATGHRLQQALWRQPAKAVALEMGGKNAALELEDADVELAAREAAIGAFSMAGQRCNATSRILLHRRSARRFLDEFLRLVDGLRIGYPLAPDTFMGPLIGRAAVGKYRAALAAARREGYEPLRPGGPAIVPGYRGHYVRPSVHLCEHPGPTPARAPYRLDEIFGPDVAISLVGSLDEAIALNNEVPYGLVTSVFTRRRRTFEAVARRVDTGLVNWNRGTIFSSGLLPFGGTKSSGNQQPAGLFAIHQCVYPVAILEDRRPPSARERPPGFPA